MRSRGARARIHLMAVLPPALLGVAGAPVVAVGLVVLVRIVAPVRDPEAVTRRRRDVAYFLEWTPHARAE